MKPKAKVKIAVDVLMTLGMLFLMGYQFWGDVAHEWAGAGMFVLFILHHALNGGWYKSLFRGKYTPFRVFQIVVDALVLLDMLGLMVSGVILSNHVFDFLPILGGMGFARTLHMLASFWGFLLMALHLGLHWNVFLGMARNALAFQKPSWRRTIVLNVPGRGGGALWNLRLFPPGSAHIPVFANAFCILRFYAPWDNTNTIQKNQEFYNPDAAKIAKDCSPELDFIHYAGPHMPPLFIWHNRYDKFVPAINPVMIAGKMIEYGLPFELHIFRGGEHGMSVCNNLLVITPSSLF